MPYFIKVGFTTTNCGSGWASLHPHTPCLPSGLDISLGQLTFIHLCVVTCRLDILQRPTGMSRQLKETLCPPISCLLNGSVWIDKLVVTQHHLKNPCAYSQFHNHKNVISFPQSQAVLKSDIKLSVTSLTRNIDVAYRVWLVGYGSWIKHSCISYPPL